VETPVLFLDVPGLVVDPGRSLLLPGALDLVLQNRARILALPGLAQFGEPSVHGSHAVRLPGQRRRRECEGKKYRDAHWTSLHQVGATTLAGKEKSRKISAMPQTSVFDEPGAKVRLDSISTDPPPKLTQANARASSEERNQESFDL